MYLLIAFYFHLDQSFVIEIIKSSIEFYGLWIFRLGYDNNLCCIHLIMKFSTIRHTFNRMNFVILDHGRDNQLFNYTHTI